jgi:DNA polymerase-3 subunit delta
MILFLYGADTYRSREKLKKIEEKFKKTDKSRVNLVKIDGERTPWKNIEKEILAAPFLHDKKLVVVENFLKKRGQKFDEAVNFLKEKKLPTGTVVVFWEDGSPDERTTIFKLLNKPKQAEKFIFFEAPKLNKWILEAVGARGAKIDRRAAELLAQLVGSDLWQVSSELDKLAAYASGRKEKNKTITADDVNLFVRGNFDENIFALTDALGAKNKRLVFKLLNEQIEAGLKENYIFAMLTRQFRILLQTKEVVEHDYPFISPSDPSIGAKIAAELGLHPYVVKKTLYQIKNYSLSELKKIYSKLLAIDMKLKKTNLNPRVLLDLFIADI